MGQQLAVLQATRLTTWTTRPGLRREQHRDHEEYYEHDNFSVGDGNHEDVMQGQNGPDRSPACPTIPSRTS